MPESSTRCVAGDHDVVKALEVRLSLKPTATAAIGMTRRHRRPSTCCADDINDHGLQEGINHNKIREVIVGTNLVIIIKHLRLGHV